MSIDRWTVYSPVFGKKYLKGDNNPIVVGVVCPIDKTPLVSVIGYDFSNYNCPACGTLYAWGTKDPELLKKRARNRIIRLKEDLEEGQVLVKDVPNIERIIKAAEQQGIV